MPLPGLGYKKNWSFQLYIFSFSFIFPPLPSYSLSSLALWKKCNAQPVHVVDLCQKPRDELSRGTPNPSSPENASYSQRLRRFHARNTQLSCSWIPDSQKLWDKHLLKLLNLGIFSLNWQKEAALTLIITYCKWTSSFISLIILHTAFLTANWPILVPFPLTFLARCPLPPGPTPNSHFQTNLCFNSI